MNTFRYRILKTTKGYQVQFMFPNQPWMTAWDKQYKRLRFETLEEAKIALKWHKNNNWGLTNDFE